MGRSFASLFSRRPAKQGFVGPTDRPLNPNGIPEARWAAESPKPKQNRPLINLNAPTNPVSLSWQLRYLACPRANNSQRKCRSQMHLVQDLDGLP